MGKDANSRMFAAAALAAVAQDIGALMEMLATLRKGKGALVTDTFTQLTGRAPRTFAAWCREHAQAFLAEPITTV